MLEKFSKLLDQVSDFLAQRKGLLPSIGIFLVFINALIQFIPAPAWLVSSNLLLHLGIVIALLGMMIAWAI